MEDIRRLITFSREVKGTGRISGYADASMKRREIPSYIRNFAIFEPTGTPSSSATGRHFAARR